MLQLAGESESGRVARCPGDNGCERWMSAAGETHEQKSLACRNCERCDGNPPIDASVETDEPDDEVAELVDEIEDIIRWEDAGFATDWSCYPFYKARLVTVWREAERSVKRLHDMRLQAILLSYFKKSD